MAFQLPAPKDDTEMLRELLRQRLAILQQPTATQVLAPIIAKSVGDIGDSIVEGQKNRSLLEARQVVADYLGMSPEQQSMPGTKAMATKAMLTMGITPPALKEEPLSRIEGEAAAKARGTASAAKTPEQIEAEEAAKARGRAAGKPEDILGEYGGSIDNAAKAVIEGRANPSDFPGFGANSMRAKVLQKVFKLKPDYDIGGAIVGRRFNTGQAAFASSGQIEGPLTYMKSVMPNLDHLQELSNALPKGKYPSLNRAKLEVLMQSGDPKIVEYATAMTETADQVAKILQGGGSGSATSDAKMKQAVELFDKGFNPEQMNGVVRQVKILLSNRVKALEGVQAPFKKNSASPKAEKKAVANDDPLGLFK